MDVHKKLSTLSNLVCKFTGANGVKFTWVNSKTDDGGYPEIDHESTCIFDHIVDNKDSLKNFLFNSKSWLFTGNDNSDETDEFYNPAFDNSNIVGAEVTLDYGGEVGKVQFNVPEYPIDLLECFYADYNYLSSSQFSCEIANSIVFENGTARSMTPEDKKILTGSAKNDSIYFLINLRDSLGVFPVNSDWSRLAKEHDDYPCLYYATKDFASKLMTFGKKDMDSMYSGPIFGEEAAEFVESNYDGLIRVKLNVKVNG